MEKRIQKCSWRASFSIARLQCADQKNENAARREAGEEGGQYVLHLVIIISQQKAEGEKSSKMGGVKKNIALSEALGSCVTQASAKKKQQQRQ
jgi:predicted NUDIX family NTP pyrophosphohydrolase